MTAFERNSVTYRLKDGEFENFPIDTKKKLVPLMAWIAEKAYRRGFQQGSYFKERNVKAIDPAKLRYDFSLDGAVCVFSGRGKQTAIERVFTDCEVLTEIGFHPIVKTNCNDS
jgi:hypothetical protein